MPKITLGFAAALIVIPIAFWIGTGARSHTALIPAVFGLLLGLCGAIALNPTARKHAMHAAVAVALVSLLGLIGEVTLREEALDAAWRAQLLKLISGLLLAAYLVLGVRSFIAARSDRISGSHASPEHPRTPRISGT